MKNNRRLTEGLHRLTREERLLRVQEFCSLSTEDVDVLSGKIQMPTSIAEHLIENVVGYFPIPMGVATNFNIDGRDLLIPMAVEETSIIAAASATAKWVSKEGSIRTYAKGNLIIGQVQSPQVKDAKSARKILHKERAMLMA
ncbi:MAG: hydroxymethylglutaryl-CoA reductase, degradative, partial [Bdellovibrionia bacterium]